MSEGRGFNPFEAVDRWKSGQAIDRPKSTNDGSAGEETSGFEMRLREILAGQIPNPEDKLTPGQKFARRRLGELIDKNAAASDEARERRAEKVEQNRAKKGEINMMLSKYGYRGRLSAGEPPNDLTLLVWSEGNSSPQSCGKITGRDLQEILNRLEKWLGSKA